MTHKSSTTNTTLCSLTLPLSPSSTTSSTSSSSSSSSSSNMGSKKQPRRFSLIRIFGSNNTPQPSSSSIENIPEHYRPSHHQQQPSHHRHNDLQSKLLRERRNSIASMSDNGMFRSKNSFDVKASRPFLSRGSSQATTQAPEMNEKMRQFDELLQTHRGGTIRISLTPSLLQEP